MYTRIIPFIIILQPRIFVFVEKNTGESLGLYLVPFEEEPLTGLYVKTIVAGKSAARLQVFDAGMMIIYTSWP